MRCIMIDADSWAQKISNWLSVSFGRSCRRSMAGRRRCKEKTGSPVLCCLPVQMWNPHYLNLLLSCMPVTVTFMSMQERTTRKRGSMGDAGKQTRKRWRAQIKQVPSPIWNHNSYTRCVRVCLLHIVMPNALFYSSIQLYTYITSVHVCTYV